MKNHLFSISRIRLLFVCFLLLVNTLETVGQEISMPSAESSSTAHGVNSPVNMYTGTVNLNIPLYTISAYGVNIPISLNYQTGGIKLFDYPTWVGLGWSMSTGGRITRIVRGYPDESGYRKSNIEESDGLISFNDWDINKFESRYSNGFDGEPDTYYYEIPGDNGMFIIDFMGEVITIPRKNIHIEQIDSATFVIRDANGVKYSFGSTESSRETSRQAINSRLYSYTSSWLVDTISYNNVPIAEFKYKTGTSASRKYENTIHTFKYTKNETGEKVENRLQPFSNSQIIHYDEPKFLEKITWSDGSVEFVSKEYSRVWDYTERANITCLNYININSAEGKTLKRIHFDTEFYNSGYRFKLNGISQSTGDKYKKLYQFTYFEDYSMPYHDYGKVSDQLGYLTWMGYGYPYPAHTFNGVSVEGASRAPMLDYARTYSLHKIMYPEGGYKVFDYGLHKYFDTVSNTIKNIGGLRIEKVTEYISDNKPAASVTYQYIKDSIFAGGELNANYYDPVTMTFSDDMKIVNGVSVIETIYGIAENYSMLSNDIYGSPVYYNEVKEIYTNGSYNVYKFRSYDDAPDIPSVERRYRAQSGTIVQAANYDVPYTSNSWQRGLPKEVRHYTSDHEPLSIVKYHYSISKYPTARVPAIFLSKKYARFSSEGYRVGKYEWIVHTLNLDSTTNIQTRINPQNTSRYGYNDMIPTMYARSDTYGNEIKVVTRYAGNLNDLTYEPVPADAGSMVKAVELLQRNHMNNIPIEILHYKNGTLIKAELNIYGINQASDGVVLREKKEIKVTTPITGTFVTANVSPEDMTFEYDSRYKTTQVFDKYDSNNSILRTHVPSGMYVSYMYGHHGTLPIAEISYPKLSNDMGEQYVHFFHTSFEEPDGTDSGYRQLAKAKTGAMAYYGQCTLSLPQLNPGTYKMVYWKSENEGNVWSRVVETVNIADGTQTVSIGGNYYIDEVRIIPVNSVIKTMTYLPGIGKMSESDNNGITIYYDFDDFGKISAIKNTDRQLIQSFVNK